MPNKWFSRVSASAGKSLSFKSHVSWGYLGFAFPVGRGTEFFLDVKYLHFTLCSLDFKRHCHSWDFAKFRDFLNMNWARFDVVCWVRYRWFIIASHFSQRVRMDTFVIPVLVLLINGIQAASRHGRDLMPYMWVIKTSERINLWVSVCLTTNGQCWFSHLSQLQAANFFPISIIKRHGAQYSLRLWIKMKSKFGYRLA